MEVVDESRLSSQNFGGESRAYFLDPRPRLYLVGHPQPAHTMQCPCPASTHSTPKAKYSGAEISTSKYQLMYQTFARILEC